ncbi:MAG TPA: DUF6794 domain-containing protein [Flavobacterium sp.]|nr:DUF6794 domain-containing protein [Flavobacterium sp.]
MRNIYKANLVLIFLLFSSCGAIKDSYKSHIDGEYIPRNLNDAVSELDKAFSDSTKIIIRQVSEEDFLIESHFGRGQVIRNDWGLWNKSRLKRYFKRKGISHPDDMSSIILTSFYRKLNNQEVRFREQIRETKGYWKEIEINTKLLKLPKANKHPESNLELVNIIHYGQHLKEKKWAELYILKKFTSNNYWIYDYYYGWKKIDGDTKKTLDDVTIEEVEQIVEMLNELFDK